MVGVGRLHTTYFYGNKYDNFSLLKPIKSLNVSSIVVVIRPNNNEYCLMYIKLLGLF